MPDIDFNAIAAAADFDNFRKAPILDTLANKALIPPNSKLEQALANSEAKGLPPISSVLEIGTLGGYSAICFAQGGAKVTSIEIDPKHRDVALENVAGLDVEVILGAALDVLPKLAEEKQQFDMVFINAEFEDHIEHFDWAVKLTRPGGCVFFDDVVPAMFNNGEVKPGADSILTHIGNDQRVKAALMPNVACHPMLPTPIFNGFVLALVKEH
ncbi:hypothetical protein LZL87_014101 [Fusarium oxysporum]|uniref:catechol O-methyltransferase n=1 Tax=Fusarium oxysporum f. sp. rapae TaxID=485398 RepID=A0A8J5NKY4_FUSOX|nr:O-methyltransferase imqG [Fusarium oxysporum f. sp. rapae]KAI7761665.1 hypothetical protein LZL87_014101 [Fusarium oxysporum]